MALLRSQQYLCARILYATRTCPQRSARAFHSPFASLRKFPLTSPPSPTTLIYEKQVDPSPEPQTPHSGNRTYVVSEADASSKHYEVPAGAFPTTAPYVNYQAPALDPERERLDNGVTVRREDTAVRDRVAPVEMDARGGGKGAGGRA